MVAGTLSVEPSTTNSWVCPGFLEKTTEGLLTSGPGVQDVLEVMTTGLDWIPYLNFSKENQAFAGDVKDQLEPIKMGLSIPQFFSALNGLRQSVKNIGGRDDSNLPKETFDGVAATTFFGSESVMFLDAINVIQLKETGLRVAKGLFWGAAFVIDGGDVFEQVEKIKGINEKLEASEDSDVKSVLEHKLNLAHLDVLKDVISIAIAGIALVSILFASIGHGLLFSPPILLGLGLGTVWLILKYVTYFYEKAIESQVEALPPGKRV